MKKRQTIESISRTRGPFVKRPKPVSGWWRRLAAWIRSPALRDVLLVFELVGFPTVIVTLILTLQQTAFSNEGLRLQRIANAVDLINTSGELGKGEAVSTLARYYQRLEGIDLSCRAIGTLSDADECVSQPTIAGLTLRDDDRQFEFTVCPQHERWGSSACDNTSTWSFDLTDAYIFGATFERGRFEDSSMARAVFRYTTLNEIVFALTDLSGSDFKEAYALHNVEFSYSELPNAQFAAGVFENVRFNYTEISGAFFCYPNACAASDVTFSESWYWEDMPPQGLDDIAPNLTRRVACPGEVAVCDRKRIWVNTPESA